MERRREGLLFHCQSFVMRRTDFSTTVEGNVHSFVTAASQLPYLSHVPKRQDPRAYISLIMVVQTELCKRGHVFLELKKADSTFAVSTQTSLIKIATPNPRY